MLKFNANIRTILFNKWPHNQQQLNLLVEDMTHPYLGVTTVAFNGVIFGENIMEALVKIFKRNTRIKEVKFSFNNIHGITDECWARFCDGLEYYHFGSLELHTFLGSKRQFRMLAEGIKHNQSITTLRLKNQILNAGLMKNICKVLEYCPTITSFKLWAGVEEQNFKRLAKVIQKNRLKHLTIRNSSIQLKYIAEALKSSTAIQSLEFISKSTNYILLGEILQANKSIKRLKLDESLMTENSILELNLSTNTNLEELSMVGCAPATGTNLFKELSANTTLKSLRVSVTNGGAFDVQALQEFLEENKSLTELILPAAWYQDKHACTYIAKGLKYNKTLRKLTLNLMYQERVAAISFLRELKTNASLTHLTLGPILKMYGINTTVEDVYQMDNALCELLTTNKSLRYINGGETFPHIEDKLKANRETQDKVFNNTCMLIKMIQKKPNSFILPMEVWSNIFKYTSYSFVLFDFEKFFKDSII